MELKCSKCGETKPASEFHKSNKTARGYQCYCKTCNIEINKGRDNFYADVEMVTCICPLCRERYKRQMFWTGRGVPRIYCEPCKLASVMNGQI